ALETSRNGLPLAHLSGQPENGAGRKPTSASAKARNARAGRCLATFPSWYLLCQTMQHPRVRLAEHCQCELCTMTQTMLPAAMICIGTPSLFVLDDWRRRRWLKRCKAFFIMNGSAPAPESRTFRQNVFEGDEGE